jgi:predicted MPP superfamily phosphohydrolase
MQETNITRRGFLRAAALGGLGAVSAAAGYANLIEPTSYELTETDIFIRDLPEGFDGFRIAQVSDVHHSRLVPIDEVQRVVQITMGAKPDLIALTGDYTTSRRRYIEPCAEALGALAAPAGVWAVLGNHDHYTDPELTRRALARAGINVLDNANTVLRRGSDTLQLAGIGDWSWAANDWGRATHGLDLKRPSVLLSHQPGVLDLPEARGFSLIISGHTHGGQISVPLFGPPARLINPREFRYIRGYYRREETQLYVSRGTGVIGLPVRFGARPEIAVLRLRRAPGSKDKSL